MLLICWLMVLHSCAGTLLAAAGGGFPPAGITADTPVKSEFVPVSTATSDPPFLGEAETPRRPLYPRAADAGLLLPALRDDSTPIPTLRAALSRSPPGHGIASQEWPPCPRLKPASGCSLGF
jgi:hypothetical protein